MRNLRVFLTIFALPVGIFAGDGYDWATNPERVWARQAADAASYARTGIEADATWRAYLDAAALQILAGMEPE